MDHSEWMREVAKSKVEAAVRAGEEIDRAILINKAMTEEKLKKVEEEIKKSALRLTKLESAKRNISLRVERLRKEIIEARGR